MRKILTVSMAAVLMIAGASSIMAKDVGKSITAKKAASAVKIDGNLVEFLSPAPTATEFGIMDTKTCTLEQGAIDSDKDYSAKFYALYDESNIYLGFDVVDDTIAGSSADANIWQNDAIEIWFDADNDDVMNTDFVDADEHQIGVTIVTEDQPGAVGHYVWRSQEPEGLMENLKYAGTVKKDGTGWTMEVKIPVADLHGSFTKVKAGQMLGFNISIVDNDEGDWNHLTWTGTRHNDPQQVGALIIK